VLDSPFYLFTVPFIIYRPSARLVPVYPARPHIVPYQTYRSAFVTTPSLALSVRHGACPPIESGVLGLVNAQHGGMVSSLFRM
jgi:hypothetical protein